MDCCQLFQTSDAVSLLAVETDFPKIGLVAVGGLSCKMLSELALDFPFLQRRIAINTDAKALQRVKADHKILIGNGEILPLFPCAAGLLALGYTAEFTDAVTGLDLVVLVAGMGGAAGTGISPLVAEVLREQQILTLGVPISPFSFEGEQRHKKAQSGIRELALETDALLPLRNSDFELHLTDDASLDTVMTHAPLAVVQLCRSLNNALRPPVGRGGIDFDDFRHRILGQAGDCAFGFGAACGESGADAAVQQAIAHPFLGQGRLKRAAAALVCLEASRAALFLRDTKTIMNTIRQHLPEDARVFYSHVWTTPHDVHDFRVSILVSGIL
jgi:cell division protein FtsZ